MPGDPDLGPQPTVPGRNLGLIRRDVGGRIPAVGPGLSTSCTEIEGTSTSSMACSVLKAQRQLHCHSVLINLNRKIRIPERSSSWL